MKKSGEYRLEDRRMYFSELYALTVKRPAALQDPRFRSTPYAPLLFSVVGVSDTSMDANFGQRLNHEDGNAKRIALALFAEEVPRCCDSSSLIPEQAKSGQTCEQPKRRISADLKIFIPSSVHSHPLLWLHRNVARSVAAPWMIYGTARNADLWTRSGSTSRMFTEVQLSSRFASWTSTLEAVELDNPAISPFSQNKVSVSDRFHICLLKLWCSTAILPLSNKKNVPTVEGVHQQRITLSSPDIPEETSHV